MCIGTIFSACSISVYYQCASQSINMRFGISFGEKTDPEKTFEPKMWISFLSFEYLVTHIYYFAECVIQPSVSKPRRY